MTYYFYRNNVTLTGRSGYRIKSDQISLLRLSFYQPGEWGRTLTGSNIIATVDKSYFLFIPSPIQVNFRYDKRTISLVPAAINQELFTPIEIELQEKSENKPASEDGLPVLAPKIRLLLKLTYPKGGLLTGFVVLLIAQLLIAVSASGIPELFKGWLVNWLSPQQVKQVIVLIPLLPIIGSFLTTFTLFLLFKRLPGTK